jgi:hypothetical protein
MIDPQRRTTVTGLLAAAVTGGCITKGFPSMSSSIDTPVPHSGFTATLHAAGPHPSLGQHADTFGRLIGSWEGEYRDEDPGEPPETGLMEVHFGWVLQGRAVQDTWISPRRNAEAASGSTPKRRTYGTTVRVFHPELAAWRAVWFNPVVGERIDLIGRRVGDDIVQFCFWEDRPEKWVFSEITARSFRWRAFLLGDDGVTWRVDTEFHLRRTA